MLTPVTDDAMVPAGRTEHGVHPTRHAVCSPGRGLRFRFVSFV